MKYLVFDIESDGLLEDFSKIHCMVYAKISGPSVSFGTTTNISEMISILNSADYIIGHNIIRYDIPALEIISGNKITSKPIDTLSLSWYLQPQRPKHGLESYGVEYKLPKVAIEDWENLSSEDYLKRCRRDVELNILVWFEQRNYLTSLYLMESRILRLTQYLAFKFECLKEQEENPFLLDIKWSKKSINEIRTKIYDKVDLLSKSMPNSLGKVLKEKPKVTHKKNGNFSVNGERWYNLLKDKGLPEDTEIIREEPNPLSSSQIKEWLFSFGWEPITFKDNVKGEKVEQISLPFGQGLCPSVKDLFEEHPVLKNIESLYMLRHRQGVLVGFLENQKKRTIHSSAHGFTNTLRLRHANIQNLPKVGSPYGEEIRGVLSAPQGFTMIGSDVSSLEDGTKRHWLYFFDPEYVEEMNKPGFDPHIDIGVLAGLMTIEEEEFYKWCDKPYNKPSQDDLKEFKRLKKVRHTAKTTNFSATYNAGYKKIAETAKISEAEGKLLFDIYWERNWAIKEVVKNLKTKEVDNQTWVYNPLSKFWYYVANKKDLFSTLNQGSGVWVFDNWLIEVKNISDMKFTLQYHDEFVTYFPSEDLEKNKPLFQQAMDRVNKRLKMNVNFSVSVDIGFNYADCH
jgi:hypothetical protein